MRVTVKAMVGVAAAGVIGGVPAGAALASKGAAVKAAAAMSAQPTAKASKSAKTRRAGTSYFAPTVAGGGVAILVSRDRRTVRRTVFAFRQTCTDGTSNFNWDANGAIPVSAAGGFTSSYDSGPQTNPKFPGETTRYVTSLRGAINKRGSKIVGTAQVTLTITKATGSVTCDTGLVPFTAND